jgi:DNA-binding NtrC family response regulator
MEDINLSSNFTNSSILKQRVSIHKSEQFCSYGDYQLIKKVLIACCNDQCRATLIRLLAGLELDVHTVSEGPDVLLQIIDDNYDVIVYDLEFSKLNGFKMIKIIRKIKPRMPLIVISNLLSLELGGRILQEGAHFYEFKPINPAAMQAVICNLLGTPENSNCKAA